jgi:excisionase family DNA binding protein
MEMLAQDTTIEMRLPMKLLTTDEVAERLGVTVRRVQAMIKGGRLPAEKMGRDWLVRETDLPLVAVRQPGRPKKGTAKPAKKARKGEK